MNLNRAFFARKEDVKERWKVIDAKGKVVGRLASEIAHMLQGKNEPQYTPHCMTGCRIIVINTAHAILTGNKLATKTYRKHTRFVGNVQEITAKDLMKKDATAVMEYAIKRMLKKSPLGSHLLDKNVFLYADENHPHKAQLSVAAA